MAGVIDAAEPYWVNFQVPCNAAGCAAQAERIKTNSKSR